MLPESPRETDDLIRAFQDQTGNGHDTDVGFRWINMAYDFTVMAGEDGTLHVLIGLWGTWETQRTHYVDDVRITLTRIG